jgi:RNA polymerase sigma-70 factor (ECF subfamily)
VTLELDRDLLERALRSDPRALNLLVLSLQPHVDRLLLRYLVDGEDRRDVLQATLIQVVRKLGSFRGESSFTTWIFRLTANEALMMLRSQRRHRARFVPGMDVEDLSALSARLDVPGEQHGGPGAAAGELGAELEEALADLSREDRELVLARYQLDLDLPEIACRFGLSNSAVRSRLHRIRGRLRSALERAAASQSAPAVAA